MTHEHKRRSPCCDAEAIRSLRETLSGSAGLGGEFLTMYNIGYAQAVKEASGDAYVLLVSSIPALARAFNQSPTGEPARLNAILYGKVVEWVNDYQRATGRPVEDYK